MSNKAPKKKSGSFGRSLFGRLFGGKRELSIFEEEQMQSPFRTVIRNFRSNKVAMFGTIVFLIIFLSCFILPIFFPLIQQYGIDPIWFGILVVRVTEIGLISPPVGLNLFVIKGVANVPMASVFRGVAPFIVADFLHVAILMAFPILSLWLPSMMH